MSTVVLPSLRGIRLNYAEARIEAGRLRQEVPQLAQADNACRIAFAMGRAAVPSPHGGAAGEAS